MESSLRILSNLELKCDINTVLSSKFSFCVCTKVGCLWKMLKLADSFLLVECEVYRTSESFESRKLLSESDLALLFLSFSIESPNVGLRLRLF